jgi:hypothetical protein
MAMTPQIQDQLQRFTLVAKAIIYNADRMRKFLQLMGTPDGAITAVRTVMGAIEQKKHIPPMVAPLLAVNCYMLMVDMAQQATGHKADQGIMRAVVAKLLTGVMETHSNTPQQAAAQPAAGGGLISQARGA